MNSSFKVREVLLDCETTGAKNTGEDCDPWPSRAMILRYCGLSASIGRMRPPPAESSVEGSYVVSFQFFRPGNREPMVIDCRSVVDCGIRTNRFSILRTSIEGGSSKTMWAVSSEVLPAMSLAMILNWCSPREKASEERTPARSGRREYNGRLLPGSRNSFWNLPSPD